MALLWEGLKGEEERSRLINMAVAGVRKTRDHWSDDGTWNLEAAGSLSTSGCCRRAATPKFFSEAPHYFPSRLPSWAAAIQGSPSSA